MDRRRFFTNNSLTESFLSESQKAKLLEETFNELNRLYEADENNAEAKETPAQNTVNTAEAQGQTNSAEAKTVLDKLEKAPNYEQFVKILDSDGKSKAFLSYLQQHYKLGDDAIQTIKAAKANEGFKKCSELYPTQENISTKKSIGIVSTDPGWAVNIIKDSKSNAAFKDPTVTYAGKYIIDGHHRWSKAYALCGPDAQIAVLDFPQIEGVTVGDMLKATQLAIVAAKPGIGLENKVDDDNMLADGAEVAVRKELEKMTDEVFEAMKAKGHGDNKEAVTDYVVENVTAMRTNNKPIQGAAPRAVMPQTDKAPGSLDKLQTAVIDLEVKN